jgi:hypothetical protein
MSEESVPEITGQRALLTDRERELIANAVEVEPSRRYQTVSHVRRRIKDNLTDDIAVLREHHPELFTELREVVCDD